MMLSVYKYVLIYYLMSIYLLLCMFYIYIWLWCFNKLFFIYFCLMMEEMIINWGMNVLFKVYNNKSMIIVLWWVEYFLFYLIIISYYVVKVGKVILWLLFMIYF